MIKSSTLLKRARREWSTGGVFRAFGSQRTRRCDNFTQNMKIGALAYMVNAYGPCNRFQTKSKNSGTLFAHLSRSCYPGQEVSCVRCTIEDRRSYAADSSRLRASVDQILKPENGKKVRFVKNITTFALPHAELLLPGNEISMASHSRLVVVHDAYNVWPSVISVV